MIAQDSQHFTVQQLKLIWNHILLKPASPFIQRDISIIQSKCLDVCLYPILPFGRKCSNERKTLYRLMFERWLHIEILLVEKNN